MLRVNKNKGSGNGTDHIGIHPKYQTATVIILISIDALEYFIRYLGLNIYFIQSLITD